MTAAAASLLATVKRPAADEFASYYGRYIEQVAATDAAALLGALAAQPKELEALFKTVPPDRETWAYAPGKWSLRQVAGHLIDAERVFGFRAFCFSRRDEHPLPSFEENDYVERCHSNSIPIAEHLREFALVRESNLCVLRRLTAPQWMARGVASGNPMTVRSIAWILAGHVAHHEQVLKERYAAAL